MQRYKFGYGCQLSVGLDRWMTNK